MTESEIVKMKEIAEELGFNLIKPSACHLLIKLYTDDKEAVFTREDGTKSAIIKPDESVRFDSFATCVGKVCHKGPAAYKSDTSKFKYSGVYCEVGDWVIFPMGEGMQLEHNKIPFLLIFDDRILGVVDDPRGISRRR